MPPSPSLPAKVPVRQLRLKEREDAGGQRQIWTERNFGFQNRDVRFLGVGRRFAERSGRGRAAAGERERDSADRSDQRTEKHREENALPAEKSSHHPEQ